MFRRRVYGVRSLRTIAIDSHSPALQVSASLCVHNLLGYLEKSPLTVYACVCGNPFVAIIYLDLILLGFRLLISDDYVQFCYLDAFFIVYLRHLTPYKRQSHIPYNFLFSFSILFETIWERKYREFFDKRNDD